MEKTITNLTFILTETGLDAMFQDLTTIKHDGHIYGLIGPITHAVRNIYSAHAVRLGDEIAGIRLVPLYTIEWDAESEEDIDPDCFDELYPLNTSYDIINGWGPY